MQDLPPVGAQNPQPGYAAAVGPVVAVVAAVAALGVAVGLGLIVAEALSNLVLPVLPATILMLALFAGSAVCLLCGGVLTLARGQFGAVLLAVGGLLALASVSMEWWLSPDFEEFAGYDGYLDLVFGPGEGPFLPDKLRWHLRAIVIVLAPLVLVLAVLPPPIGSLKWRAVVAVRSPARLLGGLAASVGLLQGCCLLMGIRDVSQHAVSRGQVRRAFPSLEPVGPEPEAYYLTLGMLGLGALGIVVAGSVLALSSSADVPARFLSLGAGVVGSAGGAGLLVLDEVSPVPVFTYGIPPSIVFALGLLHLAVGVAAVRRHPVARPERSPPCRGVEPRCPKS